MAFKSQYRVEVVGATGRVGSTMLDILHERQFPVAEVIALASSRSKGRRVSFGSEQPLTCQSLDDFDFSNVDIVLSSPGAKVSSHYTPIASQAGAVVIDNTSFFRTDPQVPLIVPEVNHQALPAFVRTGIIANPNCSTIQMVVALKPLHDRVPIKRVVVTSLQSVSGAGKTGIDELYQQSRAIFLNQPVGSQVFPGQIAFNLLPMIGEVTDGGASQEEQKMRFESEKILGVPVHATCVRVPVFISHSLSLSVSFTEPLSVDEARTALHQARGVVVIDQPEKMRFATPKQAQGEDGVFISRLRQDPTAPHTLSFWCVSDNLRKGAALNAVQIAENLIKSPAFHDY